MNISLFAHSGSRNHGCEAIVRSTAKMLENDEIRLVSVRPEEDEKYGLRELVKIEPKGTINRHSLSFIFAYLQLKILKNFHPMDKLQIISDIIEIKETDIAMSIGGDNYCYKWVENYVQQHSYAKKYAKKTVLWGCSVEPDVVAQPKIAADLARYDLITARETISYEALKKVNPNTILVADPAFLLDKKELPLPKGFEEKNTVGINVSPLAMEAGNLVYENYEKMVDYIIRNTEMQIALIPHVVWEFNNDLDLLNKLYKKYSSTGRVVLISDHNCEELKGFIARCRFFVGARTHATIAAYSTCVPTLVSGYSVKARGIAKDIFGTEENYVLPVQNMRSDLELTNSFIWLMEHEQEIRTHLKNFMPKYCQRSMDGAKAVAKLLRETIK